MRALRAMLLGVLAMTAACAQHVEQTPADTSRDVTTQREFDFTLLADRNAFVEHDLAFKTTVGPYGVYEVTGPLPWLDGPLVALPDHGGWSLICGATHFFSNEKSAEAVSLKLWDSNGLGALIEGSPTGPVPFGACTDAKDDYGNPGTSAASSGAATSSGSGTGTGTASSGSRVETPRVAHLAVRIDPPPPVGALVLLIRVAAEIAETGHNGSHEIEKVCCSGDGCSGDGVPK